MEEEEEEEEASGARINRGPRSAALTQIALRGIGFLAQLVVLAVIGRTLGAAALGAYAVFIVWQGIPAAFASAGLSMGTLRASGEAQTREKLSAVIKGVLYRRLPLRIAMVVLGIALVAGTALAMGSELLPEGTPAVFPLAVAASAAGTVLLNVLGEALNGSGRPDLTAYARLILPRAIVLAVLGFAALAETPLSLSDLFIAQTLATLAAAGLLTAWAIAAARRAPLSHSAAGMFPSSKLWQISMLNMLAADLPTLLLPLFLTGDQVGYVAFAFRVAQGPTLLLSALASVYAPHFSRAFTKRDPFRVRSLLIQTQAWVLLTILLVAVVIALPDNVFTIIGDGMYQARWPLVALLCGQLVDGATGLVSQALIMVHQERIELVAQITGLSVLAVGLPLGATAYGAVGFAAGSAACVIVRKSVSWAGWVRWYRRTTAPLKTG